MLFGMWRRTNESPRRATDRYRIRLPCKCPGGEPDQTDAEWTGLASEAPIEVWRMGSGQLNRISDGLRWTYPWLLDLTFALDVGSPLDHLLVVLGDFPLLV